MSDNTTLLDVVTPPAGMKLLRGVWLTHDVSVTAVNDTLLPILAGLGVTERSAGAAAPGLLPADALIVLAAGDRVTANGLVPGYSARIIPVSGRRQHAKVAILQFERTDAVTSTATGGILTVVTSANLTEKGLTTNREVFAAEWLPSNGGGPSIAAPVVEAVTKLATHPDLAAWTGILKRRLRQIRQAIPQKAKARPEAIAHSLASKPDKRFTAALGKFAGSNRAPERVLMVGPAFAGDHSDVGRHLSDLLHPGVMVDLVVDTPRTASDLHHGDAVRVPTAFREGLQSRVGETNLTVYAAPVDEEGTSRSRYLHGKAIVVEYPNRSIEMLGSANLTDRGLAGASRELVIFVESAAGAIEPTLKSLHATRLKDTQITPVGEPAHLPTNVAASAAPIAATFVPDRGQDPRSATLLGTLTVPGHTGGEITTGDGQTLTLAKGVTRIEIQTRELNLSMDYYGVARALLVSVNPPEGATFWTAIPLDTRPEPIDPFLRLLLRDISSAVKTGPTGGRPTNGHGKGDDGFTLPASQRLNVLTRHRRVLRRRTSQDVNDILEEFFPDSTERAVARCVVNATQGSSRAASDPLLAALAAALSEASPTGYPS